MLKPAIETIQDLQYTQAVISFGRDSVLVILMN